MRTSQIQTRTLKQERLVSNRIQKRLKELGIELPAACAAAGNYRPALIDGDKLYISGHTPDDAGCMTTGKVGRAVSIEQAQEAARAVGLAILSTANAALGGDLSRVKRIIKATGVVNCNPRFAKHPKVMDGFSNLMAEVFGKENGIGTRSATGASSLPGNVPVEVTECVIQIRPAKKAKGS
jgi:enamine deaminase RidA (YjgF/YER057c/UK114 family)